MRNGFATSALFAGEPSSAAAWLGAGAFRFDGLRRSAEVPLYFAFFFQRQPFAEHILILRVGLRKIAEAESLAKFQFAAAFAIAPVHLINTPFDFRWRAFPSTAEKHVVFDFQAGVYPFPSAPDLRQWSP